MLGNENGAIDTQENPTGILAWDMYQMDAFMGMLKKIIILIV